MLRVRKYLVAAMVAVAVMALPSFAFATDPLLPDTGVDVGPMITEVITTLGGIVAIIVGGYFAFLLIRKALRAARGL